MKVSAIILAAGKGTRMNSAVPKVLHKILGKPMLGWVLDAVKGAGVSRICLILGYGVEQFEDFLSLNGDVDAVRQKNLLGTGDAVASAALVYKEAKVPAYVDSEISVSYTHLTLPTICSV